VKRIIKILRVIYYSVNMTFVSKVLANIVIKVEV